MKELAEALVDARRRGGKIPAAPDEQFDVDEGYAVQDRVSALLSRKIAGPFGVELHLIPSKIA